MKGRAAWDWTPTDSCPVPLSRTRPPQHSSLRPSTVRGLFRLLAARTERATGGLLFRLDRATGRRFAGRFAFLGVFLTVGKLRGLRVEPEFSLGVLVQPEDFSGVLDEDGFLARLLRQLQSGADERREKI